ncbi:MAG: 37S ribosomal protein S16, mitochondrial, partial [Paramarteilia canceri]
MRNFVSELTCRQVRPPKRFPTLSESDLCIKLRTGPKNGWNNCKGRPFYRIVVQKTRTIPKEAPIENLGCFDPLPNINNLLVCGINLDRLVYWLSRGVK